MWEVTTSAQGIYALSEAKKESCYLRTCYHWTSVSCTLCEVLHLRPPFPMGIALLLPQVGKKKIEKVEQIPGQERCANIKVDSHASCI